MTNGPLKRALIFDMDGTLIDSEPVHLQAYQTLMSRYGVTYTEEDNRQFLGRTDSVIAPVLVSQFNLAISPAQLILIKEEIVTALMSADAQPMPGVLKVLHEGKKRSAPMAVASSATLATIEFVIDTLKLRSYFHVLASGDEVAHGKPAPDVFLLAARRLNIAPENCLVVEDTFNGIKAAKAAGMTCVAIPCETTKFQDHSQADVRLDSLEQLDVGRWLESGVL